MLILDTPRLRLRHFKRADAAFILELINEPAWIAGIRDAGIRTEPEAADWVQTRLIDPCWQHGHGFWRVERRADGEPLGMCGVFKRDSLPLPDLGYGLLQRHWGQGYAREAAAACLGYATEVLGRHELLAITSPTNAASNQLLRDLGFASEHLSTDGPDGPTQHWRWHADTAAPTGDAAQIDDLTRRFFTAFGNRDGALPTLAALPALFTSDAAITAPGCAPCSVRDFVEPRAALLQGGRLQDFAEWETEHETLIDGDRAERRVRYAKAGLLDGTAFKGSGHKELSLSRDAEGRWRIAALSWVDD